MPTRVKRTRTGAAAAGRAVAGWAAARGRASGAIALGLATIAGCGELEVGPPELRLQPDRPLGPPAAAAPEAPGDPGRPGAPATSGALQRALAGVEAPIRIFLEPGHYDLAPTDDLDPSCGNCPDPDEVVPVTVGVRISGREIVLEGASPDSVFVHTHAGYGLLFEECEGCVLRGVTVTDGVRDADARATSAGIVVRNSTVRLERCAIRDNIGDAHVVRGVVVGIAGIVGREGADVTVERCRIIRNSWDGIALYRGARATIRDNVIDGVDAASGQEVGGGRGVGIGLTWDAQALVEGNLVRRYWKGIGAFVDARAEVRHNIVEDLLTWGLAYWAAGDGAVVAFIDENVVFRTGACGAMLDGPAEAPASEPGRFRGNALVRTAQDPRYDDGEPYCTQVPVAVTRIPPGFEMEGTLLVENRHPGALEPLDQLTPDAFATPALPLLEALARYESHTESAFFAEFGSN